MKALFACVCSLSYACAQSCCKAEQLVEYNRRRSYRFSKDIPIKAKAIQYGTTGPWTFLKAIIKAGLVLPTTTECQVSSKKSAY